MKIIKQRDWVFYMNINSQTYFDNDKVGKWILYFNDISWAKEVCMKAINEDIVYQAKHSDSETGIICFYLNIDDIDRQKKIISWFILNNYIKKTTKGRFTNISFKLDSQTLSDEYGKNFTPKLNLSNFINLADGKFINY